LQTFAALAKIVEQNNNDIFIFKLMQDCAFPCGYFGKHWFAGYVIV